MKKLESPTIRFENVITFEAIPEDKYDEVIAELSGTLMKKLKENQIRETESIEYAAGFVTTI